MKPISFTRIRHPKGDTIHFHYSVKDLFVFHEYGHNAGTAGVIPVVLDLADETIRYHCYGTLEAPSMTMKSHRFDWKELFNSPFPRTDDEIRERFMPDVMVRNLNQIVILGKVALSA